MEEELRGLEHLCLLNGHKEFLSCFLLEVLLFWLLCLIKFVVHFELVIVYGMRLELKFFLKERASIWHPNDEIPNS